MSVVLAAIGTVPVGLAVCIVAAAALALLIWLTCTEVGLYQLGKAVLP